MATGTILFDMAGAIPADGTGTGNTPAQGSIVVSTGTPPANAPKVTRPVYLFDPTTDEHIVFPSFRMPENYVSGGTLYIIVYNVTLQSGTNNFVVKACLAAITPGEDVLAKVFPAPDTVTIALANNQAAGISVAASLALSATALNSVAAGEPRACLAVLETDWQALVIYAKGVCLSLGGTQEDCQAKEEGR